MTWAEECSKQIEVESVRKEGTIKGMICYHCRTVLDLPRIMELDDPHVEDYLRTNEWTLDGDGNNQCDKCTNKNAKKEKPKPKKKVKRRKIRRF